jgi:hypothetical protein
VVSEREGLAYLNVFINAKGRLERHFHPHPDRHGGPGS